MALTRATQSAAMEEMMKVFRELSKKTHEVLAQHPELMEQMRKHLIDSLRNLQEATLCLHVKKMTDPSTGEDVFEMKTYANFTDTDGHRMGAGGHFAAPLRALVTAARKDARHGKPHAHMRAVVTAARSERGQRRSRATMAC